MVLDQSLALKVLRDMFNISISKDICMFFFIFIYLCLDSILDGIYEEEPCKFTNLITSSAKLNILGQNKYYLILKT